MLIGLGDVTQDANGIGLQIPANFDQIIVV
jgi:hypothetical protein